MIKNSFSSKPGLRSCENVERLFKVQVKYLFYDVLSHKFILIITYVKKRRPSNIRVETLRYRHTFLRVCDI